MLLKLIKVQSVVYVLICLSHDCMLGVLLSMYSKQLLLSMYSKQLLNKQTATDVHLLITPDDIHELGFIRLLQLEVVTPRCKQVTRIISLILFILGIFNFSHEACANRSWFLLWSRLIYSKVLYISQGLEKR